MQTAISYQKECWVPMCSNTAILTPHKSFFYVPMGEERKKWNLAMGRILPPKANRFVCEDHFDLENDTKNYGSWKEDSNIKLRLKKGILPHRNGCRLVEDTKVKENNVETAEKSTNTIHRMEDVTEVGTNSYDLPDSTRLKEDHFNVKIDKFHDNGLETYVFIECETSRRGFKILKKV